VAQDHHLQVETRLNELSNVLRWFNRLHQEQLPRSVLIQCQTALAEAFTTAVR
jgi:anti-sigma regulatory factor (Ser/Thr protein kinase)